MKTHTLHKLDPADKQLIEQIAGWYFNEWAIPKESTIKRLTNHPNDDILFQIVIKADNIPVATGGLYNNVGLFNQYPLYKKLKPWVALLYTNIEYRNIGLGTKLLNAIEHFAKEMEMSKLYLFTYTAEALYKRNGWRIIERLRI